MREWRVRNREHARRKSSESYHRTKNRPARIAARRNYHLKVSYGLSLEVYQAMLKKQRGRCAACGNKEPSSRGKLHVDHNHTTLKVRALLCSECNPAFGLLREDPDRIKALLRYARKHSGKR